MKTEAATTFISVNPATGECLGVYANAADNETACAVARARTAAGDWSAQTPRARAEALQRLHNRLARDADTLAATVTAEIGKPLQESYGADVLPALAALRWLIQNGPRALRERRVPGARHARLQAQPYGAVGVIGTWNYPLYLNLAPIAWALLAGNAIVWKPSELATATALALAERFEQERLPVITILGDGATGRALCQAGCDKITFTGGVATGRAILRELANYGTPSVMELSGNDAMIVCDDADIGLAAQAAVWGRCCNAGQSCVAPQRIFVAEVVYPAFLDTTRRIIETLRLGADIGPMRTEALRARADALVQAAVGQGARLITGGRILAQTPNTRADGNDPAIAPEASPDLQASGFFYAPTLLADCHSDMAIMTQDFFGPVLPVCPTRGDADALARANASDMALGASVWTKDRARAARIAGGLNVGMVSINEILLDAANPALPFGGLRASGFGRQRGLAGLEEFVQWKTVARHASGGVRRHFFPYRAATLPILRAMIELQSVRGWKAKLAAGRKLGEAAMRWDKEDKGGGN